MTIIDPLSFFIHFDQNGTMLDMNAFFKDEVFAIKYWTTHLVNIDIERDGKLYKWDAYPAIKHAYYDNRAEFKRRRW